MKKLLKTTLEVILVLLFLFFEELVWKRFAVPVKNMIIKTGVFNRLEASLREASPYQAVIAFVAPLAIAELAGLYAGFLAISGNVVWAAIVYGLKIPIASGTLWVFQVSKEKLLSIDWFKTLYDLLFQFLNWLRQTDIYKSVRLKFADAKAYIKNLMGPGNLKYELKRIYRKLKEIFDDEEGKKTK